MELIKIWGKNICIIIQKCVKILIAIELLMIENGKVFPRFKIHNDAHHKTLFWIENEFLIFNIKYLIITSLNKNWMNITQIYSNFI